MPLYSIKMRASKGDLHVSGAERIILQPDIGSAVSALTERALHHGRKSWNTLTLCPSANVLQTR